MIKQKDLARRVYLPYKALVLKNDVKIRMQREGAEPSVGNVLALVGHVIDDVHDLLTKSIGFLHGVSLGVNADDGLGVALAEMYPLVGEVDLHTIDVGHLLVLIEFLHLLEDSEDVGSRIEVDAVPSCRSWPDR